MTELRPWLDLALGELGVHEIRGGETPRILEYHASCDGAPSAGDEDEDAWCSSFINWLMMQCQLPRTKSRAARSWLTWGRHLEAPVRGCVVVFWRESPQSWKGHVGIFLAERDGLVHVLGGNQGNKVCVTTMPVDQVLDYRGPPSAVTG